MSKILWPLILRKIVIIILDNVVIQSQTKPEFFQLLEQNHQIFLKENMKAASDKSQFFLTRVKFLERIIKVKQLLHENYE